MNASDVQQAARLLAAARCVCVSTGAGMSAESGVPTFRDAAGLWSDFNPDEYATPEAFQRDPRKVWSWYRWRRQTLATVAPHAGHIVLAEWARRVPGFVLVTQNVDGLHHRAGSPHVLELHGRLDQARCIACDHHETTLRDLGEDPHCPRCNARLRPGVVWFGELLPADALEQAFDAARRCDVFVVIGTSGVVQPAASLVDVAHAHGAAVVEINPAPAFGHAARVTLRAACGEALVAVDQAWRLLQM